MLYAERRSNPIGLKVEKVQGRDRKNDDFLKNLKNVVKSKKSSTSLPGGNQVDGLPPAQVCLCEEYFPPSAVFQRSQGSEKSGSKVFVA